MPNASARRRLPVSLAAIAGLTCACGVPLPDDPLDDSLLAGWKAGITCSAVFVAGCGLADVIADELASMPPATDLPDPVVDTATRSVLAPCAPDREPRLAVYREGIGCTTLPPGATLDDALDAMLEPCFEAWSCTIRNSRRNGSASTGSSSATRPRKATSCSRA